MKGTKKQIKLKEGRKNTKRETKKRKGGRTPERCLPFQRLLSGSEWQKNNK